MSVAYQLLDVNAQTTFTNPVVSSVPATPTNYNATVASPYSDITSRLPAGSNNTYNFTTNNKRMTSFLVNGITHQYQKSQSTTGVFVRRNRS
ncbi:hypothetical protein [Dyadobacter sp. BHUBP1]|uniref:hypothetical protein n=1 Tax=Dyadobacter sp. BHUBP1 TaxID=3424178 RepID=UPI003D345A26